MARVPRGTAAEEETALALDLDLDQDLEPRMGLVPREMEAVPPQYQQQSHQTCSHHDSLYDLKVLLNCSFDFGAFSWNDDNII